MLSSVANLIYAKDTLPIIVPMFNQPYYPVAKDLVAAAVEGHLRTMEVAGHGEFLVHREKGEITLTFGPVEAKGETYEVVLLRLACALLANPNLSRTFLTLMQNPALNPPAIIMRDNRMTV